MIYASFVLTPLARPPVSVAVMMMGVMHATTHGTKKTMDGDFCQVEAQTPRIRAALRAIYARRSGADVFLDWRPDRRLGATCRFVH